MDAKDEICKVYGFVEIGISVDKHWFAKFWLSFEGDDKPSSGRHLNIDNPAVDFESW